MRNSPDNFEEQENKEKEPVFDTNLKVDLVRHAKPTYTEDELASAKFEGYLKEEDKKNFKQSISELIKGINKEKEIVVIWSSPKQRARETAEAIKETLEENGIQVLVNSAGENIRIKESLKDISVTPELFRKKTEIKKSSSKGEEIDWFEYWTKEELPENTETPEEVLKRAKRLVTYLVRVAREIEVKEGKKLHFIIPTHEELFKDLLEEGFEMGTEKENRPVYGEILRLDIGKFDNKNNVVLNLRFRGQEAKINFNSNTREIYKNE